MCIDCKTYQNYLERLFGKKPDMGEVKQIFHGSGTQDENLNVSYTERQLKGRMDDEPPTASMSLVPVAPNPPIFVPGYEKDIPKYEERMELMY